MSLHQYSLHWYKLFGTCLAVAMVSVQSCYHHLLKNKTTISVVMYLTWSYVSETIINFVLLTETNNTRLVFTIIYYLI